MSRPGNSTYVDPFLGNDTTSLPPPEGIAAKWWCAKPPVGNTHPGATLPFGMLSVCAYSGAYVTGYGRNDVSLSGDDPRRLFDRHEILGLAHFQQSGTGRIRQYYNYFLTTPLTGNGLEGLGTRHHLVNEEAKPGFYAGKFEESGVTFEATCTKRTAVHRYCFPSDATGKVAVDFSSGGLLIEGMGVYPEKAKAIFLNPTTCQGRVIIEGIPFYFHLECTTPLKASGFWENGEILEKSGKYKARKEIKKERIPFGAWFEAEDSGQPIEIRIGFSLHCSERPGEAVASKQEMSFEEISSDARAYWDSVLGKIHVEGGSNEMREIFYTALYHATLKPADFMDENPFSGPGPFFFDLSTLWDLYKTQLPLLMTLWPELGSDFVSFLLDVAKREGAFPVSYLMDNAPERLPTGLMDNAPERFGGQAKFSEFSESLSHDPELDEPTDCENWNYSFRFIHDMVGRINLAGGEERFVELLDLFFGYREPEEGQTVHRFEDQPPPYVAVAEAVNSPNSPEIMSLNQGPENFYVQRAWLNGNPLDRCYLKLSEFAPEASLTLEMGPEPSEWATRTRPPSFIS